VAMSCLEKRAVNHSDLSPPAGIRIASKLYCSILDHMQAAAPREAVALLAVEPYEFGSLARAVKLYLGTNVDGSSTRYTMEPREVIAALDDIDDHDWWLGAIVHSHPATPPVPSATDLREAYYPEALTIIVSLATHPPTTCAWRMSPRIGFTEVPLMIEQQRSESTWSVETGYGTRGMGTRYWHGGVTDVNGRG
jgi:proteasome lid subunit RPN8/RPN11